MCVLCGTPIQYPEGIAKSGKESKMTMYAIKVVVRAGLSYSHMAVSSYDDAVDIACKILNGDIASFETQRGTTVFLSDYPETVEVIPFNPSDTRRN